MNTPKKKPPMHRNIPKSYVLINVFPCALIKIKYATKLANRAYIGLYDVFNVNIKIKNIK
ncbi:MAG: hypothetical protein DHS20C09_11370 [marine bacterium B5-7]|nr:MAG: hypothetical protein DHS20C09_11370 [marine bacterium B5-7]